MTASEEEYRLVVVDLFCGAGGFSTGLIQALIDAYEREIAAETDVNVSDLLMDHPEVQAWLGTTPVSGQRILNAGCHALSERVSANRAG